MERIKLNIQRFANDEVTVKLTATVDELQKSLAKAQSSLKTLKKEIVDTDKETSNFKKTAQNIKSAFSGLDISGITNQIKRLGKTLYSDFLTKAIDTSEELNLFNVVFDNMYQNGRKTFSQLGKEATQFQNTLNEAFGTNKKETMRYQGLFQAMGESAGLDETVSKLMSENMTKLAYDLASLYNTTETKAAESLRAGVYAGQTKPLRNYGIDVTQTSYKPLMQELGLEKSVSELTQAEKEVLRYIATLRQAGNAMGDFANTIESPANQLKVLKQQFYEMQAAIGNLFMGAFARMLPYVNGIIMAIKAVANAIAGFFGIELKDYNTGIASYADDLDTYSDGLDGVSSSAGGASKAIDKLKRQTLAFDQINNLTTPTPSSGSGGGGGGGTGGVLGAIDSRLLDAIKGYENGMESVRMKATEIRDKIMGILGFTKHINPLTKEIYFTYDGWKETVKGIFNWFVKLTPAAKTFVGIGVAAAILKIVSAFKKLGTLTGVTQVLKTLFNLLKGAITPLTTLTTKLVMFSAEAIKSKSGLSGLGEGLKNGINAWREQEGIIDSSTGKLNGFTGVVQGAKNVLLGLGEAALGLSVLAKSMDNMTTSGANFANVMGTAGGAMMSVFGGAQAGAVFGPWGAAIGAVVGALAALGTAIWNANNELTLSVEKSGEAIDKMYQYSQSVKNLSDEKHRLLREEESWHDSNLQLVNELKQITDENGRVKEGYEDRAIFITGTLSDAYGIEMKYQDGVIQNYKEEVNQIEEAIAAEKRKAEFEAYKEIYIENMKKEAEVKKNLQETNKELENIEGKLYEARAKVIQQTEEGSYHFIRDFKNLRDMTKAEKEYKEGKEKLVEQYKVYFDALIDTDKYQRAMVEKTKGNYDEFDRIMAESTDESIRHTKEAMIGQATTVESLTPDVINKWAGLAARSEEEYKDAIDKLPEDVAGSIQVMTGHITRVTPEVVDYFYQLGQKSKDQAILELKELPNDLQTEVINKLKEKGNKIPEEIQCGIDEKPKPNVELKTDERWELQQKVNNATSGVSGSVKVTADTSGMSSSIDTVFNNKKYKVTTSSDGWVTIKKNAFGGIFANGKWQQIQGYANGGLPSGGQLFMAREAGPELVGKIGRHTAVMNNNQIVDSVKAGVYEAVSAAMGNANMGGIEIVAHTDEGVVIDRINRITRQTGECPIDI